MGGQEANARAEGRGRVAACCQRYVVHSVFCQSTGGSQSESRWSRSCFDSMFYFAWLCFSDHEQFLGEELLATGRNLYSVCVCVCFCQVSTLTPLAPGYQASLTYTLTPSGTQTNHTHTHLGTLSYTGTCTNKYTHRPRVQCSVCVCVCVCL